MVVPTQSLFTAARLHGEVNFTHTADQARAMQFKGLICSTDDGMTQEMQHELRQSIICGAAERNYSWGAFGARLHV